MVRVNACHVVVGVGLPTLVIDRLLTLQRRSLCVLVEHVGIHVLAGVLEVLRLGMQVVGYVLLILNSLVFQLSVNFLLELDHMIVNSLINLFFYELSHFLSHIERNLLQLLGERVGHFFLDFESLDVEFWVLSLHF